MKHCNSKGSICTPCYLTYEYINNLLLILTMEGAEQQMHNYDNYVVCLLDCSSHTAVLLHARGIVETELGNFQVFSNNAEWKLKVAYVNQNTRLVIL